MIVDCNLAASRLFGHVAGDATAHHLCDVIQLDGVAARRVTAMLLGVSRDREPGAIDRIWLASSVDGVTGSWYQMRVLPELGSDGPAPIYVVVHDIAESVESEMRLSTLALTDPLTGGPTGRPSSTGCAMRSSGSGGPGTVSRWSLSTSITSRPSTTRSATGWAIMRSPPSPGRSPISSVRATRSAVSEVTSS